MNELSGRVALVTGASRGIGRAVALALARNGADVAVSYLGRRPEAEDVTACIRQIGRKSVAIQADIRSRAEADRLVQTVNGQLGPVSILVNNAGVARPQKIADITEQDWDDVVDTNLKSSFMVTQAVLETMRAARWGRIINISSVVGESGNAGQANYVASKAGLIGLTKSLAQELGSRNITVNAVTPGFIDTDMTALLNDAVKERMLAQIPLKRFGKPEDVASAVRFLASDDAAYVTGSVLRVNGGMYL
jgi:3-oxoacyl-[acyl-carrier protein] reductase